MKYEIDFIGVNKEGKDADAICFRYFNDNDNKYHIGIYDGGTTDYGVEMKDHIEKYYKSNNYRFYSMFAFTHRSCVWVNRNIKCIYSKKVYMNRPWLYKDELFELVKDGRIRIDSLEERLRKSYKYIEKIETICNEKNIKIEEAFEGVIIDNRFRILSPTKQFYIDLLSESNKTPEMEKEQKSLIEKAYNSVRKVIKMLKEIGMPDSLREDVETEAENETSVIMYGDMEEQDFIFVADAGIRAINKAMDYMETVGIDYKKINIYQIPHHGSKHNVSPSLLNRLLGNIASEGMEDGRIAFALVSKNSEHPKRMVTNAYKRRGVRVFETKGKTICHSHKTLEREGWNSTTPVEFYEEVEEWDD